MKIKIIRRSFSADWHFWRDALCRVHLWPRRSVALHQQYKIKKPAGVIACGRRYWKQDSIRKIDEGKYWQEAVIHEVQYSELDAVLLADVDNSELCPIAFFGRDVN